MKHERFSIATSRWQILVMAMASACFLLSFHPAAAMAAGCLNESLRTGASAALPDCRAYELVSPPNSNGRMVVPPNGFALDNFFEFFPTELLSPSRDSILYMTYAGGLPDQEDGTGIFDLYE